MFFVIQGWTQTTLNESFEGTTFPPENWTISTTSGSGSWYSSATIAHTGTKSASSAYASNGCTRWLITPKLSVTSDATFFAFWIATNEWYNDGDNIDILVSTTDNQTSSFSTTSLLSLNEDSVTTTWVQHSVDLSDYVGQDIYVAIRVVDNNGFNTFIDDISGPELFVPTCPKPRNITTSNITTTSANISWTNGNDTDASWWIFWKESTATNYDSTLVNSNPYVLPNLLPSTEYDIYMKTNCIGETSESTAISHFRTLCDAISTLPWSDNMNTYGTTYGTFPPCWTRPVINDYVNSYINSYTYHSSPASLMSGNFLANTPNYVVTPAFSADINTLMVSFWSKISGTLGAGTITVGIMDTPTNLTTFEAVRTITPTTTDWTQYVVMLSGVQLQGGNKYIAFKYNTSNDEFYYYLDDVTVDLMPDCPNVYELAVQPTSTTSVSINWNDEGDDGSGYVIGYSSNLTSVFNPALATPVNISTGTTLPYILSGFNPGDSVWVAVQRGCNGAWSNAVRVNLPTFANTLPFVANFEDPTQDNVWTITNGTETNKWYIGAAGANDLDISDTDSGRGLYISNDAVNAVYNNTSSSVVFASTLVQFDNSPSFQLSFDWAAVGEGFTSPDFYDYVNVYLLPIEEVLTPGTLPSSLYKINETELNNAPLFQAYTLALNSTYSNTVKQLVFAWKNDGYGGDNPSAKIDNISLVSLTCGIPSGLTMDSSGYNGTTAYLSWTEPQNATGWIIEYKTTDASTWNQVSVTTNPYTITNLIPGTNYQARIRSICSTTDTSSLSDIIAFQTTCTALTVPTVNQEFNTFLPSTCWESKSGLLPTTGTATLTSDFWGWYGGEIPIQSGFGNNACLYMGTSYSTINNWLITPSYNLGDGTTTYQLEFDVLLSNYDANETPNTAGVDDRFAVVVSTDNGLTWNVANATIWSNQTGAARVLNNLYPLQHIIFPLINPTTSLPYSGNIKIGFYGESTINNATDYYNYLFLDNLSILPFSTCQRPTSLISSNLTSSDATIAFVENGTATAWQYVITDGTITDPNNGTIVSSTTNPIQITGLLPQTYYTVWVRSDCSTETSLWSTPITFRTEALPGVLPYTCDFENPTEQLAWNSISSTVNKWAIGTAAGNGSSATGNQANYISNDNGASYAMSDGTIYSYTYRDIDFGTVPASYNLSFDWKCQGYFSTYESTLHAGLKVYLRDPSEIINTSDLPINPNNNLGTFYNSSTWQNEQLTIDNISGVKRLMFVYFDEYYNPAPPAAIDNISLVQANCPRPTDVAASNLTTTTVDISWLQTGADSYIVSYSPTSDTTLIDEAAITSPYTIQGLTLGTRYIVSVRAICGSDTTIYSSTITFQTPCYDSPISIFPYTEGFENGISCWSINSSTNDADWISTLSGVYPTCTTHGGAKMIKFNSNGLDAGEWSTIYSPLLDFPNDQYQVSFWLFRGGNDYLTTADKVELYINSTASETGATLLGTVNRSYSLTPIETSVGWHQYSFTIPAGTTGNHYIILKGISENGRNIYVDDVDVTIISPCLPPTALTVPTTTITNTTATVNWTAGDQETAWQVRLGVNGNPIDVTTTSYQLTNLVAGSNDTVYVRANCGGTYSSWVSQTFTTTTGPQAPIVTTSQETGTTQTSTILNGSYIQGTNPILVKGFQWKQSSASVWNNVTVSSGTSPFSYSLNGLNVNTQYEFRAYVETSLDTTYGSTLQFTTLAATPPSVTTEEPNQITNTSATLHGTITQGSEEINARGFEYKLPTEEWADAVVLSATGTNSISAEANNLQPYTSYNVRAYARTNSNTYYGQELNFQTLTLTSIDQQPITVIMYPNPATNETKLIVSGVSGDTKIVLSDVQGRILNTINTKAVNGVVEQTIDVNNLAKGVYYVRIKNSNLSRTNKLIVK